MIISDLLSIGNPFWPGLMNHLWQSTLFVAAAWLITIFLKKNRARIRYWIWFTASIKFLIPFSLIVSLGGMIAPEGMKAPVEITPHLNLIQTINQPFNPQQKKEMPPEPNQLNAPSPASQAKTLPWVIISLWLCGFSAVLIRWYKQRMQASQMVRKAEPLKDTPAAKGFHGIKLINRIPRTVQIVFTRDTMEPGVFGIFRPVILLPSGLSNHIDDSELETILLHEFEHIRCKDNLIAFIHMIVESLFWFHPLVWWTGSRLITERELACDEAVLRSTENPRAYAEGILKVCEFYFISPLPCVSGVIGSNLKKRIEAIIKKQIGRKMSLVKILFLSLSGLLVLCIPLTIGMINAPPIQAHPSDSNSIEHKIDADKINDIKAPLIIESTEVVIPNADRNISSAVTPAPLLREDQNLEANKAAGSEVRTEPSRDSGKVSLNEAPVQAEKVSNRSVMDDNSPRLIMAKAETQTTVDGERETGSVGTVRESVLTADAEESVLFAQKNAPALVSSEVEDSSAEPETEDSAGDRNRSISNSKKSSAIPEKYNLDNELEAIDQITAIRAPEWEYVDKQSIVLKVWRDYYLLVLRRPMLSMDPAEISLTSRTRNLPATHQNFFGAPSVSHSQSGLIRIESGYDMVVVRDHGFNEDIFIDKIYKLKDRKQMKEIRKQLREG